MIDKYFLKVYGILLDIFCLWRHKRGQVCRWLCPHSNFSQNA